VIDSRRKRNAGITIAAEIVPFANEPGKHQVFCGLSYCAPVERQFSRPRGRLIARERLSSGKNLPFFKQFGFVTESPDGLKYQILSLLRKHLGMDWAQSLVGRELARLNEVRAVRELDLTNSER
jgi:hypothetical protein